MKFRPNQTILNRQNFVCNLIQLTSNQSSSLLSPSLPSIPSVNHSVQSDMKVTGTNNNTTSSNSLNSVTGLNNLGNTCFFNSILQVGYFYIYFVYLRIHLK